MYSFNTEQLLFPSLAIFFVTLALGLAFSNRPGLALFAALTKSLCFFVYFNLLFDGTYQFLDDWRYLRGGQYFYEHGGGTQLFENMPLLISAAGGEHFLYFIHNIYAITLFGEGYFAPVALNIILTSITAWMGAKLAEKEFGWQGDLRDAFFFFLLLFPDIVAWSTIMNGKDILVLLLHVVLLHGVSNLYSRRFLRAFLFLAPAVILLPFLRFYVPVLFVAAYMGTSFLAGSRSSRVWGVFISFMALAIFAASRGGLVSFVISQVQIHFVNPILGFPRFLLTPIPFNTGAEYAFLDLPALFHWLMLPFMFLGTLWMYRLKTPFTRFFLVYIAIFVALYSFYGQLQGPRQRVQLDFAIAALQFAGIFYAAQITARRRSAQKLAA